jgi:hypothetical protein
MPAAEVARTVRVTLRNRGQAAAPDQTVVIVVTDTIRAAADQESGRRTDQVQVSTMSAPEWMICA